MVGGARSAVAIVGVLCWSGEVGTRLGGSISVVERLDDQRTTRIGASARSPRRGHPTGRPGSSSPNRLATYALMAAAASLIIARLVSSHWFSAGPMRTALLVFVMIVVSFLAGVGFDPMRDGLRRTADRLRDRRH